MERLHRSKRNKVILGVCGGLAEYFHMDPTLVRIICILIAIPGPGFLIYLVAALLMPEDKGYSPDENTWGGGTGANPYSGTGTDANQGAGSGSYSDKGSYSGSNTDNSFNSDFNTGSDDWNRPAQYNSEKNKLVLGVILVGLGVLFLGKQIWPALFELKFMVPVLLILVGGAIVFKGRNQ